MAVCTSRVVNGGHPRHQPMAQAQHQGNNKMKTIASITFAIASAIGACVAAASVASLVMAEPEPHSFTDLAAPEFWTTKPVRVDPATQRYERLAPVLSTYVTDASAIRRVKVSDGSTSPRTPHDQRQLSAQHQIWCSQRFRSFDPATNTYRSYGGDVRQCVSPFDQHADDDSETVGKSARATDAAWCASRYKSYRAEDNTYQPYGKARRPCGSPGAVVATSE